MIDVLLTKPDGSVVTVLKDYVPKNQGAFEAQVYIDESFPIGKYTFSFSAHKEGQQSEPNEEQAPFYVARVKQFSIPVEGQEFFVKTESIEYEVSNLTFDKETKSIRFDIEKIQEFPEYHLQFPNQIGITIQRPLISPPFTIQINENSSLLDEYMTKITDEKYSTEINLYGAGDKGTVTLIGTYVVPEFASISIIVLTIPMIGIVLLMRYKRK